LKRALIRRGSEAADRFETEALDYHQKLREAYRTLAEQEPARCVMINARSNKQEVSKQIWNGVLARFARELPRLPVLA
jgi:dTMP kinase